MENAEKFYNAWMFIQQHPKFMYPYKYKGQKFMETFPYGLDIAVVKVNPKTMSIDDDDTKNTKVEFWLEYGPYEAVPELKTNTNDLFQSVHDIDLDCGAETFEGAIITLAALIKKKYGDYESQKEEA